MDEKRFMELRKLKMEKMRKHILLYTKLCLTGALVILGFLIVIPNQYGILRGILMLIGAFFIFLLFIYWIIESNFEKKEKKEQEEPEMLMLKSVMKELKDIKNILEEIEKHHEQDEMKKVQL